MLDVLEARLRQPGDEENAFKRAYRAVGASLAANPFRTFAGVFSLLLVILGLIIFAISPVTLVESAVDKYKAAQERDDLVEQHVELGDQFLSVEQIDAARAEYRRAIELDSTDPAARRGLFKATVFEPISRHEQFDPEVVEMRLQHLLDRDPGDADALAFLGDTAFGRNDYTNALAWYDQALHEDHHLAHAYSGKGIVLDLQGKPQDAARMFEAALKESRFNPRYRSNLAYQYYRLGRYKDSVKLYQQALGTDPRALILYNEVSSVFRLRGQLDQAHQAGRRLLTLMGDRAVRRLKRNGGQWFLHTASVKPSRLAGGGGQPKTSPNVGSNVADAIFLNDFSQKRYYALLNLSLTSFVRSDEGEARTEAREARRIRLEPLDARAIRGLVAYDAKLLGRKRPKLAASSRLFRRAILHR
ncbi:MAG: tetratricopeptide repeat protein [Thermoleophilaceae bacterium]